MSKHSALNPVPLSMIICNSASRDVLTSKFHLHGVFSEINPEEMPITLSFAVYAAFTNIREKASVILRVVDEEDEVLYSSEEVTVEKSDDPMEEADVLWFLNVEFSRVGRYFVQLWSRNEYIIERCLWIQNADEDAP